MFRSVVSVAEKRILEREIVIQPWHRRAKSRNRNITSVASMLPFRFFSSGRKIGRSGNCLRSLTSYTSTYWILRGPVLDLSRVHEVVNASRFKGVTEHTLFKRPVGDGETTMLSLVLRPGVNHECFQIFSRHFRIDLMTLQTSAEHPHGLSDREFNSIFTTDKPVIFAFHGYPTLIHRLTYKRANHDNFHVHGYREEGTTTTPFDMTVLNELDRFHLAGEVVDRVARFRPINAHFKQLLRNKLVDHKQYICEHGDDLPEIREWKWPY
jgi:hypothetical protein